MIKAWCERCPSVYNVYMIKVCCLSYKLFFTGFNKACRGVAATSFPQGVFCVCDLLAIFLFSPWSVCVFIIFYLVFYASCVHCLNLTRVSLGVSASPVLSLWWPPCLIHSPTLFLSLYIYIYMKLFVCVCCISHRMKLVLPVEYWPTSRTMGLLSKSASSSAGEWNSWNL